MSAKLGETCWMEKWYASPQSSVGKEENEQKSRLAATLSILRLGWTSRKINTQDMHAMNDPHGQTRATVPSVAITILASKLFSFVRFWKERTDGRADVQTTRAKIDITNGRDCESASWIKSYPLLAYTHIWHKVLFSLVSLLVMVIGQFGQFNKH